jgi:hypothetical protein
MVENAAEEFDGEGNEGWSDASSHAVVDMFIRLGGEGSEGFDLCLFAHM